MTDERNSPTALAAPAEPSKAKTATGLSVAQVLAGGGAAAIAAVIGGKLGVAGTVIGAFIVSIISGVALPLIRTTLERGHQQLKRVVPSSNQPRYAVATQLMESGPPTPAGHNRSSGNKKVWLAVGGTAAAFMIAFGAIFGVQALTGSALSQGTGALQPGAAIEVKAPTAPKKDTTPVAPATPSAEPSAPESTPSATPQSSATAAPTQSQPTPSEVPQPSSSAQATDGTNSAQNSTPAPTSATDK